MPPHALTGLTLGKYRLLEPLGRGGMAQVYRAYHPQLDRYVAIKVLRSDLVEEAEFLARFQREARSVAALRHPNIVQVYDADVQDGIYYMVMELLEGDTLKARLNAYRTSNQRMPLAEVIHVLADLLAGLGYAHGEGIIHRDIKPANILLSRRGQAVLTDFGIAQIIGGTQYTLSGALMGTLSYMAPEQGLENLCDIRSDLYSLGIVFYEMLTGKPPFDADTPLAILMKHLNDPLPLPRQLNPDIPQAFERVVLKALAKRPEDRYQTAAEMAKALQTAAEEAQVIPATRFSLPPLPGVQTSTGAESSATSSPSEGAVYSGTARQQLTDLGFADDNTDPRLSESLKNTPLSPEPGFVETRLKNWFDRAQSIPLPGLSVVKAAALGVGLLVVANICAVSSLAFTRHGEIFGRGWPMELLLVGILLALLLSATGNPWLLVPSGILVGTGLVMAFYSITNLWVLGGFIGLLEPLVVAISLFGAFWLARPREKYPDLAKRIGYGLTLLAVVGGGATSIGVAFVTFLGYFR